MSEVVKYRFMKSGEEAAVSALAVRVFREFVAPLYSLEGVHEFLKYAHPTLLSDRSRADHFVLVATSGDEIVGMIELRECNHVCMLFVDGRFQQKGIAKELLRRALAICRKRSPDLRQISVNSSPNSVHVYEKLGFRPVGPEKVVNGIRFTPMLLNCSRHSPQKRPI